MKEGLYMREHFYQKTWFKNLILILIPSAISVIGVLISVITNQVLKIILIFVTIVLMLVLCAFVFYFSSFEDKVYKELEKAEEKNKNLTKILAHMENDYKTVTSEVSIFSDMFEKWSSTINSFTNNIKENRYISDKAWDKARIIDTICFHTKNVIQQYCNKFDNSNVSTGYISYRKDRNGIEWIHMISHSNPVSIRPNACKGEVKLSECTYHYADLIRNKLSDFEIAMDNNEILRIFNRVSVTTDLNKYTQYIAIPLYCKSGKLLGIFQIVTKNGYIIESDRDKMRQFATDIIMPFSNLIVLADKIYKGLYINPTKINKEI